VFVGGVEVGRYTGPASTASATGTRPDPKPAGGDKNTTAVDPFADGPNDLAAAVAVFSIVASAALAFLGLVVGGGCSSWRGR